MSERREIRLDESDVVAAAQILSWIAWPHRPEHGVALLNHWFWARRRLRGEDMPSLPFALKKKGRALTKLFGTDEKPGGFWLALKRALEAGHWFDLKVLSGPNAPPMFATLQASTRGLALARAQRREDGGQQGNEIRDIWSRPKPIAHLASAVEKAVVQIHDKEGKDTFSLEMMAFHPIWVREALASAEMRVRHAKLTGAFESSQFYHFIR